jgi:hypothetical protein
MGIRRSSPDPGSESRLVSIDTTTGALTEVHSGPGVNMNPSPLPGNEVGYIRKDSADAGIYYTSGSRGPRGTVRAAAWSPDGTWVVFHRRSTPTLPPLVKMFSRNPNYELNLSGQLPVYSVSSPRGPRLISIQRSNDRKRYLADLTEVSISRRRIRLIRDW